MMQYVKDASHIWIQTWVSCWAGKITNLEKKLLDLYPTALSSVLWYSKFHEVGKYDILLCQLLNHQSHVSGLLAADGEYHTLISIYLSIYLSISLSLSLSLSNIIRPNCCSLLDPEHGTYMASTWIKALAQHQEGGSTRSVVLMMKKYPAETGSHSVFLGETYIHIS